jgi:hypothetical protein
MKLLLDNLRRTGPSVAKVANFQYLLYEALFSALPSLTRHVGAIYKDDFLRLHKCLVYAVHGKYIEVVAGSKVWFIYYAIFHSLNFTLKPVVKSISCFYTLSILLDIFTNYINYKYVKPSKQILYKEYEHLLSMELDK